MIEKGAEFINEICEKIICKNCPIYELCNKPYKDKQGKGGQINSDD